MNTYYILNIQTIKLLLNMKKIFITGGGGYIGARLVPILLKKNFKVTVYDTFFFGNELKKTKN